MGKVGRPRKRTATGYVEMRLPMQSPQTEFEILTKSPFVALFSSKKEQVKFNIKDYSLLGFL